MAFRRSEVLLEEDASHVAALEGGIGLSGGNYEVAIGTGEVCSNDQPTRLIDIVTLQH